MSGLYNSWILTPNHAWISCTVPSVGIQLMDCFVTFYGNLFMWVLTIGPLNALSASFLSYEGSDYKISLLNCIPQCKSDDFRTQDKRFWTSKTFTCYHTDHTIFFALQMSYCQYWDVTYELIADLLNNRDILTIFNFAIKINLQERLRSSQSTAPATWQLN
jgi:hypothetical protein